MEVNQMKSMNDGATGEYYELKQQFEELKKSSASLNTQLTTSLNAQNKLKSDLTEKEKQLHDSQATNDQLKLKIDQLLTQIKQLQNSGDKTLQD